jgi:SAM-dependent methyltransferase
MKSEKRKSSTPSEPIKNSLVCPECKSPLEEKGEKLVCIKSRVKHAFPVRNGIPFFLGAEKMRDRDRENRNFLNQFKGWLKKNPKFYQFLTKIISPVLLVDRIDIFLRTVGNRPGSIILNLGSGIKKINPNVVNIDLFAFPGVNVVADLEKLPYADRSVDGLINEYVLEHVPNPIDVLREMNRILKPAGLLYVALPFLEPFHPSPNDYYRWTKNGIREFFADYEEIKIGIAEGPTGTINWILQEWLSLVLSFGWEPLYRFWTIFFMIILFPLKVLDIILNRIPFSDHIAGAMYFIGRKK